VSGMRKGLLLASIQVVLVLSLGGKLLYDRMTRPRVWVLSQVYDPNLPIRGRYLSQQLRMPAEGFIYFDSKQQYSNEWYLNRKWAYLEIRNGQLIAKSEGSGPGEWIHLLKNNDDTLVALSEESVLFFVPDNADLPALKPGQEMWVEVTIPVKGPPRPIRIGIKKDGILSPLNLK
jgi:hypothetical protein